MTSVTTVLLAVSAFAAANTTDLFVLVSFFSKPDFRTKQVVAGQYVGVGLLIVLCLFAGEALSAIPRQWIRLLGIMPMLVGVHHLAGLRGGPKTDHNVLPMDASGIFSVNTLTVASVALADCSDNIAIFVPLFAHSASSQRLVITAIFFTLIGAWCAGAYYLVHNKQLGHDIRYYGQRVGPFILIGLGIMLTLAK